ncbi:hypothetical protein KQI84_02790 [bacterium]|nr:hypothetical protein [bacterium]
MNQRHLSQIVADVYRLFLLTVLTFLISAIAFAANPIGLADDGQPLRWAPGSPIVLRLDQGTLGLMTNEEAEQLVRDATAAWSEHAELNIQFEIGKKLGRDVTVDDLAEYGPGVLQGYNSVIFDDDGSILQALGYSSGVVGLSGIENADAAGRITESYVILNGTAMDGISEAGNIEVSREEFLSIIVHELGHLLGLGHSDLNGTAAGFDMEIPGYGVPPRESIETMYSYLTAYGATPELDDLAYLAQLYPADAPTSATLFGNVTNIDGAGVPGIHISARSESDPFFGAVGTITGARTTPVIGSAGAGEFVLAGLTPGHGYSLGVTQIKAGSFPQFVYTDYLNVVGTPVLGLYPGPDEYLSDPETELDTGALPIFLVGQPGEMVGPIELLMNNVARERQITQTVAKLADIHTTPTAQSVPYPVLIEGSVFTSDQGEIIITTPAGAVDDIEDYYHIVIPENRRARFILEGQSGGALTDLDLYLFRPDSGALARWSATTGSREVTFLWNIPGELLIGVSSYDPGNVPEETPFRLWITDTEPVRSGLTIAALEDATLGQRELIPLEVVNADRNEDGVIDGADVILQTIDPAKPQRVPQ